MPHPRRMTVHDVLLALYAETLREIPPGVKFGDLRLIHERWMARHGLVTYDQARRLLFVIERYHDELEYDLHVHCNGASLDDLFRARRWRFLLNLIDHLPRQSWYTEAVSNDDEHAEMIAKAMAERPESERSNNHPSLRTWTEEASLLAGILDAIHALRETNIGLKGGKAKQPQPTPRPMTALERYQRRAVHQAKESRHKALVARLLPHKAAES